MKTAAFILCLAFSSSTYSGKCRDFIHSIFQSPNVIEESIISIFALGENSVRTIQFLTPQRELFTRPGIEVVGTLISSKKTGEQIAQNLADFDRAIDSLGLEKPTLTKVIVSDRTILPSMGSIQYEYNLSNLWRKSEANHTIHMKPILYSYRAATNPLILFHERTHSVLTNTYNRDSFVLINLPVHETLADFLPTHFTGKPEIIKIMGLSRNVNQVPQQTSSIFSLLGDPNGPAKKFSYTLWTLRERMGKEEMTSLIRPFIDGLNQYHESFTKKYTGDKYEYFMAVLKKTLREKGHIKEADEFISEISTELGLDVALVDDIAVSITKSDKNFYSPTRDRTDPTSLLSYMLNTAYISFLAFGYIYIIISFLF